MNTNPLSRRRFLVLGGVAAGVTALAACVPPTPPSAAEGSDMMETVTLSLGHHWEAAFQGQQDKYDAMFEEKYPNIELENVYNTWSDHNQVVPTWAAADTLPDIVYVHGSRAFPWAFEGITVSLDSHIAL